DWSVTGVQTCALPIFTAPENQQKLARYKTIAQRLAKAEGLTESDARALAEEGKAVVWIDGGIHANETLGAQQIVETVFQLVNAKIGRASCRERGERSE